MSMPKRKCIILKKCGLGFLSSFNLVEEGFVSMLSWVTAGCIYVFLRGWIKDFFSPAGQRRKLDSVITVIV